MGGRDKPANSCTVSSRFSDVVISVHGPSVQATGIRCNLRCFVILSLAVVINSVVHRHTLKVGKESGVKVQYVSHQNPGTGDAESTFV